LTDAVADALVVRPSAIPAGIERLQNGVLWLIGFSGAFVRWEPAPYEAIVSLGIVVFAASGLKLRPMHIPLIALLIATTVAYGIGVVPVMEREGTVQWAAVSCFMAASSLFFAMVMAENTERRLAALMTGYLLSALMAAFIGVAAWAHVIPSADYFLINGRAMATFKDANVYGPFLILPLAMTLSRLMAGQYRSFVANAGIVLLIGAGLFFSFSRGAWGHFVATTVLMLAFNFLTARSNKERIRILVFAAAGAAAVAFLIVLVLSIDSVAALFRERASLVQSYDAGPQGRFGRYLPGFLLMLDNPIGIGPMQFTRYFPEDPHDSFLDAFVAGGWLGGTTHLALMVMTLALGLRQVFVRTPWQRAYIAIYATFAAEVGESVIIDVQHWRHFYLLLGLIWGLMAVPRAVASGDEPHYSPARLGA